MVVEALFARPITKTADVTARSGPSTAAFTASVHRPLGRSRSDSVRSRTGVPLASAPDISEQRKTRGIAVNQNRIKSSGKEMANDSDVGCQSLQRTSDPYRLASGRRTDNP